MKNNFVKGIIIGFIFTLIISSICNITFYGLDYGIASELHVYSINIVFMIVSALIILVLKKLKIIDKVVPIASILLVGFGILVLIGIFNNQILNIVTSDYVIPGPTVKIPNILWLLVLICVGSMCISTSENEEYSILKFIAGEVIAVVIFSIIQFVFINSINIFDNAMQVNKVINDIIRGGLSIAIIMYSLYNGKNLLNKRKEKIN